MDETQSFHKALTEKLSTGDALKVALSYALTTLSSTFASCDTCSPSTYFRLWGAKVKGNTTTGKDPYYKDSVLVVGRGGKILYQQTLKDIVKDKFDFDAVIKAAKAGLI